VREWDERWRAANADNAKPTGAAAQVSSERCHPSLHADVAPMPHVALCPSHVASPSCIPLLHVMLHRASAGAAAPPANVTASARSRSLGLQPQLKQKPSASFRSALAAAEAEARDREQQLRGMLSERLAMMEGRDGGKKAGILQPKPKAVAK
jgi:hypothetical protein